jgi:hypothetical protein
MDCGPARNDIWRCMPDSDPASIQARRHRSRAKPRDELSYGFRDRMNTRAETDASLLKACCCVRAHHPPHHNRSTHPWIVVP